LIINTNLLCAGWDKSQLLPDNALPTLDYPGLLLLLLLAELSSGPGKRPGHKFIKNRAGKLMNLILDFQKTPF
jgi:hypothetical protein